MKKNLFFTGDIILNNKIISNTLPEDRRIGLLLQDPLLFPHLSVKQNMIFGMKTKYTNKQKTNLIEESLLNADMKGFEDRL